MSELFRFSFDDSGIRKSLDAHSADIKRHEELIEELQKMIRDRPTFADMERMREDMMRDINEKIGGLEELVGSLQTTTNKRLEQLHDELTEIPKNVNNDKAMMDKEELEGRLNELTNRIEYLEKSVNNNTKNISETNGNLEKMTNAYAGIVDKKAPVDSALNTNLWNATSQIKDKFKTIFDTLAQHGQLLSMEPEREVVEREITKFNNDSSIANNGNDSNNDNSNQVDIMKLLDISNLEPAKEVKVAWEVPPVLPKLHKFDSIIDNVGYTYQMVPKLQAYLYSMHDRMDDLTTNTRDFSGLEDLLAKLKDSILAMDKELNQLKNALKKSVTRQEVLDMLRDNEEMTGTSVGSVRCIACGREVTQVAGAMSEIDALKTLGAPPNSIAVFGNSTRVSQMYTNDSSLDYNGTTTRGLDTGIIESPRSTRSYKASPCRVTRRPRQSPK